MGLWDEEGLSGFVRSGWRRPSSGQQSWPPWPTATLTGSQSTRATRVLYWGSKSSLPGRTGGYRAKPPPFLGRSKEPQSSVWCRCHHHDLQIARVADRWTLGPLGGYDDWVWQIGVEDRREVRSSTPFRWGDHVRLTLFGGPSEMIQVSWFQRKAFRLSAKQRTCGVCNSISYSKT